MRKETGRSGKRAAAIVSAAVMVALTLLTLAAALWPLPYLGEGAGAGAALALLAVYALVPLAVVAGVIAALVQRLREIRGGEEDDAKKY